MQTTINLSNRLKIAASFLPEGSIFADIGSDHAYLPCYVCLGDKSAKAIAGEINEGPYSNAVQTVKKYNLEQRIDVRLGNGLEILRKGEINHLVITGMGGALIRSILETGTDKLMKVNKIIAQPNNESRTLRRWLTAHSFTIIDEEIMEENGHIYEIIVAARIGNRQNLTEKALLFGPVLMKKQSDIFIKKWNFEHKKYKHVIEEMKKAKVPNNNKIVELKKESDWIREVIRLEK
ncbi:class I SAM-dependent methyltransferase [Virgibacillus sp. YIM 98842]|uniref:tRNA (adenine(22)-N(1))-methyltransferase n=1 Tax=Virgibacillus sp. YIM 98842 TaxID=2663533 RepID=UPI0013D935A6|nr:class I SAM-dependent methyltransferase [Virgibacillus sp. YIM 98842]